MTAVEIPLSMAAAGKPLRLVRIDAGRDLTRRLADLGLAPGVEIQRVDTAGVGAVLGDLQGWGFGGFGGRARGRRGFGRFGGSRHGRPGGPVSGERPEPQTGLLGRWGRRRFFGRGFGRFGRRAAGSVIVEFRGSKLALGYGVSQKIMVAEE